MNKRINSKLALGTAQFGMDYGLNNKRGKIPKKEVFEILNFAVQDGIDILDTAHAYGESEKTIGEFIRENTCNFKIVSKLPSYALDEAEKAFYESLKRLNVDRIYAYLIHDFKSFTEKTKTWDILKQLRIQGRVQKIGFSLYHPKEVEYLLEKKFQVDIVQVPYSVFDQRFSNMFPLLKERGVEIHARSVFLQGLMFKQPSLIKETFLKIKNKLLALRSLSKQINVLLSALCIDFAILNQSIDKVIVGVDTLRHIEENVKALDYQHKIKKVYNDLLVLKEDDHSIILPTNWNHRGK